MFNSPFVECFFTGPVKRRTRHPSQTQREATSATLISRPMNKLKIALTAQRILPAYCVVTRAVYARFLSDPETIAA